MSVGNKILKSKERLPQEKLEGLKGIPAANIGDASNRIACLYGSLIAYNHNPILGQAYTVRLTAGDNLFLYYAIMHAEPGDIIVVDGNGYLGRALMGEIMSQLAIQKEIGGFIIDGAIRDPKELSKLSIPIFAKGVSPNGPYKNGPGEINVPVSIDGQVIMPGDILAGDEEGIAIIHPEDLEMVTQEAKKIVIKEANMKQQIQLKGTLDLSWMYEKLKEIKTEIEGEEYV